MNLTPFVILTIAIPKMGLMSGERIEVQKYKTCPQSADIFGRRFSVAEERSKFVCSSSCERDSGCYGITFKNGKCYMLMDSGGAVLATTIVETFSSLLLNPDGLNATCLSRSPWAGRTPNFTLTFDGGDDPAYGQVNAGFGPEYGRLGNGTDLTGTYDYVELNATITNTCPLTVHQCASREVTYAFWAKILIREGYTHMMANYMVRFRVSSGSIQLFQWDFPDGSNQRRYDFTMSNFDKYDQWVHLVVSFKPDGTNDAFHFYINGLEMNVNVVVGGLQTQSRTVNRLVFGLDNGGGNDARWYFDEFYAWDAVLTPYEVYLLYNTFPED